MWNKLPTCLKGGLIGDLYFIVLTFINTFCPVKGECFTSLFMIPIFSPLIIIEPFLSQNLLDFVDKNNLLANLIIWFVIGFILGVAYSLFRIKKTRKLKVKTVL